MWLSPRLSWPPPCSLRAGGGLGEARVSVGKRGCSDLSGGWWASHTNVLDLDLAEPNAADARRLEVVADGWPLFGGAQLAVDTTIVSTLHANGEPRRVHVDGVAVAAARQRKERRCPELVGRRGRARLVVPVVKVCGRWSQETQKFLSSLARAKARSVPPLLRKRVEQAWRLRCCSLFSFTVAGAVASSLFELPDTRGADGLCPASHEVERDFRHAGLDP